MEVENFLNGHPVLSKKGFEVFFSCFVVFMVAEGVVELSYIYRLFHELTDLRWIYFDLGS